MSVVVGALSKLKKYRIYLAKNSGVNAASVTNSFSLFVIGSPGWVFGSHHNTSRNKREISCIGSDLNELGERPHLLELSYISINRTGRLSSNQSEEVVVRIDEALRQGPVGSLAGT